MMGSNPVSLGRKVGVLRKETTRKILWWMGRLLSAEGENGEAVTFDGITYYPSVNSLSALRRSGYGDVSYKHSFDTNEKHAIAVGKQKWALCQCGCGMALNLYTDEVRSELP